MALKKTCSKVASAKKRNRGDSIDNSCMLESAKREDLRGGSTRKARGGTGSAGARC